jgi:hypothetical protein
MTTTGTWNVVNGRLAGTNQVVRYWDWGTRRRPQFSDVYQFKIAWVSDQQLAFALDEDERRIVDLTNIILQRVK